MSNKFSFMEKESRYNFVLLLSQKYFYPHLAYF